MSFNDTECSAAIDRMRSLFPDEPGGGADHPDILTFGENDPLRVSAELIEQVAGDRIARGGLWGNRGHGKSGACSVVPV
jgi:hypothetical protein